MTRAQAKDSSDNRPPGQEDLRLARGNETRGQILQAAAEVLSQEGSARTTMRAVSERAGVHLSLVHYHFGGKKGLMKAVLEQGTQRVVAREKALYEGPESLAEKWRKIVEYLRDDISSGYVRVLWELWSAGLAEDELAQAWSAAVASWRGLVEHLIEEWSRDADVDLPLSPRALATLVVNAFHGAEVEMLVGVDEEEAPHLEAFEAIGKLLDRFTDEVRT